MPNPIRSITSLSVLAGGLVLFPALAAAQEPWTLSGRLLDADNAPVPGQAVLLHRVTPEPGAMIAGDTTDAEGRFVFRLDEPPATGGLYFAAARYDGQLFIGPMLRPPLDADSGYVLRVGVPGTGLGPMVGAVPSAQTTGAVGSPLRWGLALVPLIGLVALGLWLLYRRSAPSEHRRLLVEVARLDEAGPGDDADAFHDERARIVERIRSAPDR